MIIKKIYLKNINLLSEIDDYKNILFIKVRSTGRLIKAKTTIKGIAMAAKNYPNVRFLLFGDKKKAEKKYLNSQF